MRLPLLDSQESMVALTFSSVSFVIQPKTLIMVDVCKSSADATKLKNEEPYALT